ncbi:MAG: DUF1573 domain-containing protein [Phycisphaeraceae bacterium]|nr:MAG: DUF1573 domain-containing protein [Phycisphaeraceae bacterium]
MNRVDATPAVLLAAALAVGGGAYVLASTGPAPTPGHARPIDQPEAKPAPALTIVGEPVQDAGTLTVNDAAVARLLLRNTASLPAEIRLVSKTCPCVSMTMPDGPIPPGGDARVTASYAALAVAGRQFHEAVLEARFLGPDGAVVGTQRFTLGAACEVSLAFLVEPARLWVTLAAGATAERRVFTRSESIDALNLNVSFKDLPGVRHEGHTRHTLPEGDAPDLRVDRVRFTAPDRPGLYAGSVVLTTALPEAPSFTIPAEVRVVNRVRAVPAGFPFILDPGSSGPTGRAARLTSRDGSPVRVAKVVLFDDRADEPPLGDPRAIDRERWPVLPESIAGVEWRAEGDAAVVTVTLDTDAAGNEGVARAAVFGEGGVLLAELPLAWVRRKSE